MCLINMSVDMNDGICLFMVIVMHVLGLVFSLADRLVVLIFMLADMTIFVLFPSFPFSFLAYVGVSCGSSYGTILEIGGWQLQFDIRT